MGTLKKSLEEKTAARDVRKSEVVHQDNSTVDILAKKRNIKDKQISVRINADTYAAFGRICEANGITINSCINILLLNLCYLCGEQIDRIGLYRQYSSSTILIIYLSLIQFLLTCTRPESPFLAFSAIFAKIPLITKKDALRAFWACMRACVFLLAKKD